MVIAERIIWHGIEKAYIHTTTGNPMQHGNEVVPLAYDTFESVSEYTEIDVPSSDEVLAILTGESE